MTRLVLVVGLLLTAASASAQTDSGGCKDPQLFTRMPGHYIFKCEDSQFEMRRMPTGPLSASGEVKLIEVEGKWQVVTFRPTEGSTPPSPLQVQRNFQAAAKAAGGTVEGSYPEGCRLELDESFKLGNGCTESGTTLKFTRDGKETWVFVNASSMAQSGSGDGYTVYILERDAMAQDIVANEMLDKINKEGMIALYLNFDTGSANLQASSLGQVDQIAAMLKSVPALSLEVAGHTDNVGAAEANQKLSQARAAAVVAALTARGIPASRLTATGYGATQPVADNRTEDGRAKNRRVELVKR